MLWIYIVVGIVGIGVGAVGGFYGYKKTLTERALAFKQKMARIKEIEEEMLEAIEKKRKTLSEEAKKQADRILEEATKRAEKLEQSRQQDIEKRLKKIDELESRLVQREAKLDEKMDKLEEEKQKLITKQQEVDLLIEQQKRKLEEIANMKEEEAKEQFFLHIEQENQEELKQFLNKRRIIKKEEADKEATHIIAQALPRIASDAVAEYTTVSVDLPSEDFKGKLIGREGRNIAFFEKLTGCELIIDDTPGLVRVSSFDHEKRYIGVETLKKVIKDAKVNPFYIQKVYDEIIEGFDEVMIAKGKEALMILNLPMMKPELVKMIGQYFLRYSYGQNLRVHAIEVAKIAEALASEMHLDSVLAKKAGLFHDIGKLTTQGGESHALVGADILRKFDLDPVIINAAESHHYDKPMIHPIARVVTAADAISGARPGARFNTKEIFIEKMKELEKLITEVTGVSKVHIMQAGREIMVFVDPDQVIDDDLEKVLKTIGTKIDEQLDYPGIIRVTGIREKKLIHFVK